MNKDDILAKSRAENAARAFKTLYNYFAL